MKNSVRFYQESALDLCLLTKDLNQFLQWIDSMQLSFRVMFGFAWGADYYKEEWIPVGMTAQQLLGQIADLKDGGSGGLEGNELHFHFDEDVLVKTYHNEGLIELDYADDCDLARSEMERLQGNGWRLWQRRNSSDEWQRG